MKRLLPIVVYALGLLASGVPCVYAVEQRSPGWMEITVPSSRPDSNEATLLEGKQIYNFRCSPCHGVKGDGNGPVAPTLEPRPRDFTAGNFRFRTTKTGELPTDEDLFRTITRGIPGSAMPRWAPLPADERWKAIFYVKELSGWFDDEEFSPYREEALLQLGEPPPRTEEFIREGERLFKEEGANCVVCHGNNGRGNGTGPDAQKKNAKKERIWPRDLSKSWRYKNGSRVEDIFRTLSGGLMGTPMPSSLESLHKTDPAQDERMRWAIAYFVESIHEQYDEGKRILEVIKVDGELPTEPGDPAWDEAGEIAIVLTGQVTFRPRWQTPAVDFIRVRALYNDTDIAFRLIYNDRTESTVHESDEIWTTEDTYPELNVKKFPFEQATYRDAVAIQFPLKELDGPERPYFIYGSQAAPVHLLKYEADKGAGGNNGAVEYNAKGRKKLKVQPDDEQGAQGVGLFDDGQWQIVIRRPRVGGKGDTEIKDDGYIPFTLMAWDGGNGESGLQQSISSWYSLKLEVPTPASVYLYSLAAAFIGLLAEFYLVWLVGRETRMATVEPAVDKPKSAGMPGTAET